MDPEDEQAVSSQAKKDIAIHLNLFQLYRSQENETARARPCDREEKIFEKEIGTTAVTTSQDDTGWIFLMA